MANLIERMERTSSIEHHPMMESLWWSTSVWRLRSLPTGLSAGLSAGLMATSELSRLSRFSRSSAKILEHESVLEILEMNKKFKQSLNSGEKRVQVTGGPRKFRCRFMFFSVFLRNMTTLWVKRLRKAFKNFIMHRDPPLVYGNSKNTIIAWRSASKRVSIRKKINFSSSKGEKLIQHYLAA